MKQDFGERFKKDFLDFVYPEGLTCNVCGRELNDGEREESVCGYCRSKFVEAENPGKYGKIKVYSAFEYDGGIRRMILNYKDFNMPYLTKYIARYLFNLYGKNGLSADCVAFVPTSDVAKARRGYDGMKYVAEEFSRLSGLPVNYNLFRRGGKDQTRVDIRARAENVRDQYLSSGGFSGRVVLLDDVVTTGATLNECASVVLSHGAKEVVGVTLAKA